MTTLWSVHEVCAVVEMTPRNLHRLRVAGRFPEPMAVVNGGRTPIWDAVVVRQWKAEQPESRAWRRKEAVRMYRQGATVSDIARQLSAKRDSVSRWLRAAGEALPRDPKP